MPKRDRKETRAVRQPSSTGVLFVAGIFLALGLLIGFYFGKVSSRVLAPEGGGQPVRTISNPADFTQTEAGLKAVLNVKPGDLHTLIQLGNLYYDNNRFQDAINYYGRALAQDPRNVEVRTDRGTCYWNLGQPDAAIAEFRKSLEVNPTHPQTLHNLGVVYLHGKNDAAQARGAWEKLLAANPGYPERAKVQDMIASLSGAVQEKAGSQGVEDLLERMKKR
jgi:tetratricopeptide (TPR) repeat protein